MIPATMLPTISQSEYQDCAALTVPCTHAAPPTFLPGEGLPAEALVQATSAGMVGDGTTAEVGDSVAAALGWVTTLLICVPGTEGFLCS